MINFYACHTKKPKLRIKRKSFFFFFKFRKTFESVTDTIFSGISGYNIYFYPRPFRTRTTSRSIPVIEALDGKRKIRFWPVVRSTDWHPRTHQTDVGNASGGPGMVRSATSGTVHLSRFHTLRYSLVPTARETREYRLQSRSERREEKSVRAPGAVTRSGSGLRVVLHRRVLCETFFGRRSAGDKFYNTH